MGQGILYTGMDFSGVTGICRPIFSIFAVCRMIPSQKTYRFLLYARLINLYDGQGTSTTSAVGCCSVMLSAKEGGL